MINLSIFDWFLFESLPIWTEESIVEVNNCLSDEIVTEKEIVIPSFDFERWGTWEGSAELKDLVYLGVWFIKLILVSETLNLSSESDNHVWVTCRANIARSKIETLQNVELNSSLSLREKLAFDHLF